MPIVSVVMPVYNAEKYLREAIESILYQSFADFELLIIEDKSSDSSLEIIHSYPDQRINLIQNEINLARGNLEILGLVRPRVDTLPLWMPMTSASQNVWKIK